MVLQSEVRAGHPYHMYDAVLAQPDAIERVLLAEADAAAELALAAAEADAVHVVGIGTSWHAALVGERLLRSAGGHPGARAWNSFEFRLAPPPLSERDLVILMSHRGTKRYSAQALALARAKGARTGVVTAIESAIGDGDADHVVRTCEPERSAAFTVSHTAALTALAMTAARLGEANGVAGADALAGAVEQLHVLTEWGLATEPAVRRLTERVDPAAFFVFAGAGANASTAMEAALKMSEANYARAVGYDLEQFLHGPFVAIDHSAVVTLIAAGAARDRALDIAAAARETGAYVVVLAPEADRQALALADAPIAMPEVPEALTPIVYLGPLQLTAYWLAARRGVNPDRFRLDDLAHLAAREHYAL